VAGAGGFVAGSTNVGAGSIAIVVGVGGAGGAAGAAGRNWSGPNILQPGAAGGSGIVIVRYLDNGDLPTVANGLRRMSV